MSRLPKSSFKLSRVSSGTKYGAQKGTRKMATADPKIVMKKNTKVWRLTALKASSGEIGIEKFDRYILIIPVPITTLTKAVIVLTLSLFRAEVLAICVRFPSGSEREPATVAVCPL
jgi:hypothetical protein